jgi:hypothetical protein
MRTLHVFPNLRTLLIRLDPTDLFAVARGHARLGVRRRLEDQERLLYSASP